MDEIPFLQQRKFDIVPVVVSRDRSMRYAAPAKILEIKDDAELAWMAIEPIWDNLPLNPMKRLREFMGSLTDGQRNLISLDWCQKEIRNGGHRQLFLNTTGNLVPWGIAGFKQIGAEPYAINLSTAAALLGDDYPLSASARRKALGAMSAAEVQEMDLLTDDFIDLLNSESTDLELLRGTFVRFNSNYFVSE